MKSKTTAAVLCFFFGAFGGHRFYLGQSGKGVMYLLFCWTFIPAIIAVIDFICLLVMSKEDFDQKYNRTQQQPVVNTIINVGGGQNSDSSKSNSDEINKLYEMKEKGVITQEEFEMKKKTLL